MLPPRMSNLAIPAKTTKNHQKSSFFDPFLTLLPLWQKGQKGVFKLLILTHFSRPILTGLTKPVKM
jgi:hypothetical protein